MKNFNEVEFRDLMTILNDKTLSIENRYTVFSYFVHRFESKEKVREILSFIQSISSYDVPDKRIYMNDFDINDVKISFLETYLSVVNISDILDDILEEFSDLFHSFSEIFLQHQDFNEDILEKYADEIEWGFVLETQNVSEELFMKYEKYIYPFYKSYGEYFNSFKPNHSCFKMING